MSNQLNYEAEEQFNLHLDKITDESIKQRLLKMKEFLIERINLERDFRKELSKLDAKFEKKYKPLYEERKNIINGTSKDHDSESDEGAEKGIPQYWLKCLLNTSQFGDIINKNDEAILKHLEDITVDVEESGDFEVHFHFSSNEFFKHEKLSKKFILDIKQNIQKCQATKIEWTSEEVNPTVNRVKKKLKNSKSYLKLNIEAKPGKLKTIYKVEPVESFFNFFKDCDPSQKLSNISKEKDGDDSCEESEADEEIYYIEEEYDLGIFIKDELIPYSIEYYLNLVEDEPLDDDDEEEVEEDEA